MSSEFGLPGLGCVIVFLKLIINYVTLYDPTVLDLSKKIAAYTDTVLPPRNRTAVITICGTKSYPGLHIFNLHKC